MRCDVKEYYERMQHKPTKRKRTNWLSFMFLNFFFSILQPNPPPKESTFVFFCFCSIPQPSAILQSNPEKEKNLAVNNIRITDFRFKFHIHTVRKYGTQTPSPTPSPFSPWSCPSAALGDFRLLVNCQVCCSIYRATPLQ